MSIACTGVVQVRPELAAADSAIALSDTLERLIAEGKASDDDRQAAYELVQKLPVDTAQDAFARAAIAGRLAEKKGALALLSADSPTSLVGETEKYALLSRKMDPAFRNEAATRLLGTLYVIAPANLLEGGNSEEGLDMLEGLVQHHPEVVENQLRLAEAYIVLGDKDPARTPLCRALKEKEKLRRDEADLAVKLSKELTELDCAKVLDVPSQQPPMPNADAPSAPSP